MNLQEAAEFLTKAQQQMDKYFRHDPVEAAGAAARKAIDRFNKWIEDGNSHFAEARVALEEQKRPLEELSRQVAAIDQQLTAKPNLLDIPAVDAYNRLVGERNLLVGRRKELFDRYEQDREAYNNRFMAWEADYKSRKESAKSTEAEAISSIGAYRDWLEADGPEQFFGELNDFYGMVLNDADPVPDGHGELEPYIRSLQDLRRELGTLAIKEQQDREDGLLIVPATLGDRKEHCCLMVDSASSSVSISPEMVRILNWSKYVGPEVKVKLAGGVRTTGHFLAIPSMEVAGMKAEGVRGLMLKESEVGIDGSLGLSFLNRFAFKIMQGRPPRLLISESVPASPQFDVFICYKSEDFENAQTVCDCLSAAGYRVFLSGLSLQQMKAVEYQKEIDAALGVASHMVVVCSSPEHLKARWVTAEYSLFVALLRAEKKNGKLLSVIFGETMKPEDLPVTLFDFQSIIARPTANWRQELKNYLPAVGGAFVEPSSSSA